MTRSLSARLTALKSSGEIKTGRQMAEDLQRNKGLDLFPGEGREEETDFGCFYLRELNVPLDYQHGNNTLAGILSCSGSGLALPARDKGLGGFNPREALFLDIETTGLSGGTGTWAFLVGLGWLNKDSFTLRQYFLRRPAEERAILSHFAGAAAGFTTLVTFNGKLFDLPLLNTRQLLAGLEPTQPRQHLDLLQCARALWKKRFASRSLQALEEALLSLKREDDIPGAEIPSVYFNFLRRGETELIKKVFHHNALDILSMVSLLEKVYRTCAGGLDKHPAEALALGCLCLEAGRESEGIGYLREASAGASDPLAEEAALILSFHFKRQGLWEEAVKIWKALAAGQPFNLAALVELAKYNEHRCGDFHTALTLAEKALALAWSNPDTAIRSYSELSPAALQHRINRLNRRLRP